MQSKPLEPGMRQLTLDETNAVTGGIIIVGGKIIGIGDRRDVGCGTMVIIDALFGGIFRR